MRKTGRALLVLLALVIAAADADTTTITVTTTADEDGTNASACSLREAIKAVNTHAAYGGCPAGSAVNKNVIQLGSGTYALTAGELTVTSEVSIRGKDTNQADVINPLTGAKPNRIRPDVPATGTFITAAPASRIIHASVSLTLSDLVLTGNGPVTGVDGGAIYSDGSLSLDNVVVDSTSVKESAAHTYGNGGAIFLALDGTDLSLSDVTVKNSSADGKGGAIAMVCQQDLNPYALHSVSITRTLFSGNSATKGAGVIEACGNSTVNISATTFSANSTPTAGSAAIAYLQGTDASTGTLTLSYVTAAQQIGHVIAANGLLSLSMDSSVVAFNNNATTADPGITSCYNPSGSVPVATTVSGDFNAIDLDVRPPLPLLPSSSCTSFVSHGSGVTTHNVVIPAGTARTSELRNLTSGQYGLTDYYLPASTSVSVLNKGDALTNCSGRDQRNLVRNSGTLCDIGAVERMQLTANDDSGDSSSGTDRLAVIDVLANDNFGESDIGPGSWGTPAVVVDSSPDISGVVPPVKVCIWHDASDATYPNKLVVDNGGKLTGATPITCTYHVRDNASGSSASATVTANIKNQAPVAVADTYVRPVGTTSISFNPMENDSDKNDGKYGTVASWWAKSPFYPIVVTGKPGLGSIKGTSGPCPDSTAASPKTCYAAPLTYVANDSMAPFGDTFSYRVYDLDGTASNEVTVTINSDAPNPDQGGTGGSLDEAGLIVLALLGLRRARKL